MRTILWISLLLASSAAGAQYTIILTFPDNSVQFCTSPGIAIDGLQAEFNVTECKMDKIFSDHMGG
jgi:hypothetical protein